MERNGFRNFCSGHCLDYLCEIIDLMPAVFLVFAPVAIC